jgi:hypothetical protein
MSATRSYTTFLPLPGLIAAIAIVLPSPAGADENPCAYGYTPRGARPGDNVCVTYEVRTRTQQENANPTLHRLPNGGAYGPDTCADGYVWREAFDGDTICVTPDERAATLSDNAASQSHLKTNVKTIEYEVYGSGGVLYIDVTGRNRVDNPRLPWAGNSQMPAGEKGALTVTVVGDAFATATCRIKVGGAVVDEQPVVNGTARCVYANAD